MRVLTRAHSHYGARFTIPGSRSHEMVYARTIPMDRVWRPLDAIACHWSSHGGIDLIHSFNGIPLSRHPFIITFETILPRAIGPFANAVAHMLTPRLFDGRCRRLLAMSRYGLRRLTAWLDTHPRAAELRDKAEILYPSLQIPPFTVKPERKDGSPLSIVFVGGDFARKGGIATLRAARKARARKLPIVFHIFSSLTYAGEVYTDDPDPQSYARDLTALTLPNVALHGYAPNADVMSAIEDADLVLLPSLDDTFGLSVLEALSRGTPVVTTDVCALPEMVEHDYNGFVVPMERDESGRWRGLAHRGRPNYWAWLDQAFEQQADAIVDAAERLLSEPAIATRLRRGAWTVAAERFNAERQIDRLDRIYSAAVPHA